MHQYGQDPLVEYLKERGIPVTRENYLEMAYPDGLPSPWTAELEAELPQELQEPEQALQSPGVPQQRLVEHEVTPEVSILLPAEEAKKHVAEEREEIEAWRRHRERQRRPLVLPKDSKAPTTILADVVSKLLSFAANGEFVSQLNGYEANERDIPDTNLRVCRLLREDESRPTAVRIERDGECIAWATVDDDEVLLEHSAPQILLDAASRIGSCPGPEVLPPSGKPASV